MLPTKRQKEYTISILAGLLVNIILNSLLIPGFTSYGAAIATTISQAVVVLVQVAYVKKQINIRYAFKSGKKYFIASSVMLVLCLLVGLLIRNSIISVIVKMLVGGITYFLMLIILQDRYIYEIRDMVIHKIKAHKA